MIIDISSKPKQIAYNGKWSPASFFCKAFCMKKCNINFICKIPKCTISYNKIKLQVK